MKLQDLSIKFQAYFITTGLTGSWLYDALYPHIEDEAFCQRIVDCFLVDHTYEDADELGINDCIRESYDEILAHRNTLLN